MNDLEVSQKKEWAKELFTKQQLSQKEIAVKVGISEQTLSKWINTEHWDTQRKSLMTSKQEQLSMLYDILDKLTKEGKKALEDEDTATNPDADRIIKITASIKKLETETGLGDTITIAQQFIKFVSTEELELAKTITHWFDLFIESKLKHT